MGVIETENIQVPRSTELKRDPEREYETLVPKASAFEIALKRLYISEKKCPRCKTFHTPLVRSAFMGPEYSKREGYETLEELVRLFPGEIDTTDPCTFKRAPLHISVDAGIFENCEILIKAGANVNIVDANGHTPLAILCERTAYFSKDAFKNSNDLSNRGSSLLRIAKLLIENRADLLSVTMKGISIPPWIHDVYRNVNTKIVNAIQESAKNPSERDDTGKASAHNPRMTVVQLGVDSLPQDHVTPKSDPVSFAVGTGAYSSNTTSIAVGNSPVSSGYPRPNELRCKSEKQENTDFAQKGRDRLMKNWVETLDKALEDALVNGKDHASFQNDSMHGIYHLEEYYKERGMFTTISKPGNGSMTQLTVRFFGPL